MKRFFMMALASIVLALPTMAEEEWHYTQGWLPSSVNRISDVDGVKAAATPQTLSQAVIALPALPTVEQVITPDAKEKVLHTTYQPCHMALEPIMMQTLEESQAIDARIKAADAKKQKSNKNAMAQYNANVNAGLMPSQEELMQMMMSGEINPSWPEDKIMDAMAGKFAAKWGVSKQEYLTIINLAQKNEKQAAAYIQSNHPDLYNRLYAANASYGTSNVQAEDPRDARFGQIGEELRDLQLQLNNAFQAYGGNMSYAALHGGATAYDQQLKQMNQQWETSAEAKQIEAIETALEQRVDAWLKGIQQTGGEIPYPAWWTAERKKENALIEQWNRRMATPWLKIAQDGEKSLRPILSRIAALETENEQLGNQGDKENMLYLMNKKTIVTIFNYLIQYNEIYYDALSYPCIDRVAETGTVLLGKG